jgi:hypothetical protein
VLRQVESRSLNASTTLLKNSLDYSCGYIFFTIDVSGVEEKREASPEPTASLGTGQWCVVAVATDANMCFASEALSRRRQPRTGGDGSGLDGEATWWSAIGAELLPRSSSSAEREREKCYPATGAGLLRTATRHSSDATCKREQPGANGENSEMGKQACVCA